ncbi:MAG: MBL fold metallo-hydrolase [Moraxella sp.]|nr:MBL fold metallo-hydrolase [Moraxella sp.]
MKNYVLYDDGHHKCIAFSMLDDTDESVPSNQFLIVDGNEAAIIDPGGDLTFTPLTLQITRFIPMDKIKYVIGSHQDPDILASMPRWLLHLEHARLVIPKLWERFLPHYNSAFTKGRLHHSLSERLIGIPDAGDVYPLGDSHIVALPAHFLHSVGNMQFYDPVSKILFSGDMGASLVGDSSMPVTNFDTHIDNMYGFHRRYMVSNKAAKLWANAVRNLDVEKMVPQHGKRFDEQSMFHNFLDWISQLECGIDLLNSESYDVTKLIKQVSNPST